MTRKIRLSVFVMFVVMFVTIPAKHILASDVKDLGSREFMFSPEWDSFGILSTTEFSNKAKYMVTFDKKNMASYHISEYQKCLIIDAKKAGTVNVKITVKDQGKSYKYKCKMTWNKYSNPLKSCKIGNKKVNVGIFDLNTQACTYKQSGKKKVSIKLKKGYKLNSIRFSRGGVVKTIKKGSTIVFTPKGNSNTLIFIYYTDEKGHKGVLRLFAKDKEQVLL